MLNRRRALKLLAVGGAVVVGGRLLPGRRERGPSFYVAGARFHAHARDLKRDDPVRLRRVAMGGNEIAYAVEDEAGRRLGFVPRRLVAEMERLQAARGRLTRVAPDGVPWRRYGVEVTG